MGKFSILRDDYDEEDDEFQEEEDMVGSAKRRRTSYNNNNNNNNNNTSPTAPFIPSHFSHFHDDDMSLGVGPTPTPTTSSSSSSKSGSGGGPVSVILSDPDVFDCSICFLPLTLPVFQCDNGHTACSSCCKNLSNKCPSCGGKIGNNRCRAIEKVIESVQVSCCYLRHGCQETINYCKKHEHEEKCAYAPCSCPFPDCLFRGSPRELSQHVGIEHADLVIQFHYDSVFSVSLSMDTNFIVFREERDGILFILSHGNTIAIRCIDPSLSNGMFAYDLVLRRGSTSLKFQSVTHCTRGRFTDPLSEDYILIPGYFYPCGGLLELEICIRSKDATSHANVT